MVADYELKMLRTFTASGDHPQIGCPFGSNEPRVVPGGRASAKRSAHFSLTEGGREGGAYIRFVKRSLIQVRKTVSLRDQFLASEKNYRASLLRYKTRFGWVLGLSPASAHSSHKPQEERNTAFKHLTPSVGVIVILASFSCISRSVGCATAIPSAVTHSFELQTITDLV